ncbi:MAG: hypothetical protein ACREA5_06735, partial [Nitrosotalea sp.]
MLNEIDTIALENILEKYQIDEKTISLIKYSLNKIDAIDEFKTFRYQSLEEFDKKLSHLNELKKKATESF